MAMLCAQLGKPKSSQFMWSLAHYVDGGPQNLTMEDVLEDLHAMINRVVPSRTEWDPGDQADLGRQRLLETHAHRIAAAIASGEWPAMEPLPSV